MELYVLEGGVSLITLFACVYQRLSASHSTVFFSHNKSASASHKQSDERGE
jgi:hypothetical protein